MEIGEGVTVDSLGRGWFTLGGSIGQRPAGAPNHAQVVMYDPVNDVGRIYYLPGDNQFATGIAWDPHRGRVWVYVMGVGSWAAGPFLVSFDPDKVCYQEFRPSVDNVAPRTGWNFLTPLTSQTVPTSRNCAYDAPASCVFAPGQYVGTCSNNPRFFCSYKHDCVLVEQICPPRAPGMDEGSVDDANCYHSYFLPGTFFGVGIGVDPDGAVWYANTVAVTHPPIPGARRGCAGRSLGRLDPETGGVQLVPLPTPLDFTAAGPYELRISPRGDVVTNLSLPGAIARLDRRKFLTNPARCLQMESPNPADDCSLGDDPAAVPPPTCQNPCVEVVTDSPGATYRIDSDPLVDRTWYSRGYVRHKRRQPYRVLFPPLGLLYPSAFRPDPGWCLDGLNNPRAGLGEGVAIDHRAPTNRRLGHAVCGKTGCGFELRHLTPVEAIGE